MIARDDIGYGIERSSTGATLVVEAADAASLQPFDGSAAAHGDRHRLEGPLSAANAAVLREQLPWLTPRPLGLATSAGVGDRLGLATPGHIRAFRSAGQGIAPIFAQQSIRENERTGRTPQEVLDDATFGCVEGGWTDPVGADADHLKTTDDIDSCLAAGFVFFTLDPCDHVQAIPDRITDELLATLPWERLDDDLESFTKRYDNVTIDTADWQLTLEPQALRRAAVKYAPALAVAIELHRHLIARANHSIEVEVAVDESDEPTTLIEHAYMVLELQRLGVDFVSYAPRYPGRFEKGVDYLGDPEAFAKEFGRHADLARALGPYKLSLHSGSDKFSVYEASHRATDGLVHLKTAGTSYLEALAVAARTNTALFREIYAASLEAYRQARASYHVSARYEAAPKPGEVGDEELPDLLDRHDPRQILHVGFGTVLQGGSDDRDGAGTSGLGGQLRALLLEEHEQYTSRLEHHVGRHLAPFSSEDGA